MSDSILWRTDGSESPSTDRSTTAGAQATRGRMGKVAGVRVVGTGSYVPTEIVTNDDMHALGHDSDWIVRRTGILERRRASADQATSDLAFEATVRCLASANVDVGQIDLIVVATITPDHSLPSTACHLQQRLGALAPAMDVNAACAGFMYGMITASQFAAAGNASCALVVGADIMSRMVNPNDRQTAPLFGDGAGAILLTPDSDGGEILAYQMGSEGCGGELICRPAGGSRMELTPEAHADNQQYLTMAGRSVFKWAVRVVEQSTQQVLAAAGFDASDVTTFLFHQANQRIIDAVVSSMEIPAEKVVTNLDRYGNTSGASIPLVLDEAMLAGRIERGDLVVIAGFGAGLTWCTALIRW